MRNLFEAVVLSEFQKHAKKATKIKIAIFQPAKSVKQMKKKMFFFLVFKFTRKCHVYFISYRCFSNKQFQQIFLYVECAEHHNLTYESGKKCQYPFCYISKQTIFDILICTKRIFVVFFFAFVIRLNNVTDDRKKKKLLFFQIFLLICVFSILNLIIFILHTCSVRKITQTKIKSIQKLS